MDGDIEEYPFIFMNTPASLRILASVEMALMVWRCEYANTSHLYQRPSLWFEPKLSYNEVLVVPVPHRIQVQINKTIVSIGEELREWIEFHSDQDFLNADSTEAFRKCFKHIVADYSGSIGYKASAMNMLNSGEFSNEMNYKIACTFCLEDHVKRFWPSVANESRIDLDSEDDEDECDLSYWNDWMESGGNSITDTESVRRMAKKAALSYWNGWMNSGGNSITDTALVKRLMKNAAFQANDVTAFDYFSKMLPEHERVSEIISLVSEFASSLRRFAINYRAVMRSLTLHTLGRVHAEEVFMKGASFMFQILTKNDKNFQYAHRLWTLMGHLILENELQFYYVVLELWRSVDQPWYSDGLDYTQYGQINNLLLEIWSHASDELKAYVSNNFLRDKLFAYSNGPDGVFWPTRYGHDSLPLHCLYGHDMTFMLEITSKWSGKDKNQLWQNNWRELALRSKPLYLEQFMRMCLPNDNKIELFKNKIAAFEDLFKSLIKKGFYSDLKDYLMFCTNKDAEQFQQLGKKVLESNLNLILFHDYDKFAKFDWFVSEVFANVQKDVEEFKMLMISSPECLKFLLAARRADKISSNDFISRVVNRFVTDEGKLLPMKDEIAAFKDLFKSLIEEGFYSELKDYLMFCTKDAVHFQQLGKKVLGSNVDLILFHDDDKFAKFDWFVSEVFANVQKDAEEFKMLMISSPKCVKFLLAACQADKISSNDFSRVVDRFVTDEGKLLQQVKCKLFEHCRTYPVECTVETFNADHWQKFLEWCTANHKEISAFKRSLNVEVIFLKRLKSYLDGRRFGRGLDFLDNFLKWYFGNEEDAKIFKLEKVKNYKEIDFLRVEVEKNCIYLEGLLHKLLVWLFDNNTENAIEFFKTRNIVIRHRTILKKSV